MSEFVLLEYGVLQLLEGQPSAKSRHGGATLGAGGKKNWWKLKIPLVEKIRPAPVAVGSLSHYLRGVLYIQKVVVWEGGWEWDF